MNEENIISVDVDENASEHNSSNDNLNENSNESLNENEDSVSTDNASSENGENEKSKKSNKALSVVKKLCTRWFIDAFSGMALGLFATLIAGTIICQIGSWCGNNAFAALLKGFGNIAKMLMGAGIGIGIAYKLKSKPLVIFTAAVAGLIGAFSDKIIDIVLNGTVAEMSSSFGSIITSAGAPGNPIGAYVVALFTVEIAGLYAGKTKFDIILIPLGMIILSLGAIFLAWPFIKLVELIGKLIVLAINAGTGVKIITGIFIAVVMGVLLTMPTSSAAIWISVSAAVLNGGDASAMEALSIAGGAAVAGCAAHMIGFAVASFKDNGFSGLISQGLGTSMLQIPNIMRKPIIMVPEIVASAFAGLVAVLLDMRCNASGGGMGTSGLVGLFGVIDASGAAGIAVWKYVLGIILTMFVIPAVVSFGVYFLLHKFNLIKDGDQKI